ncbi:NADH dehydrogenase subunit J [Geotalea uraniireducens]|uniref:NADH-quinone oxidoreductase subunit J n=1 Tax=Geotalea uraniireducens TaxID=351604 RepID=A0ABN6VZ31_9BACT|nr:NADH-quinone oxidoreductase subunit J [Geotalea uraniireducens]BDV44879.1 NADH dehydrogenase subunit J [Geotalea uraniireducens]
MTQLLFYILAAVMVIATVFSITEKHAVHAIVYLVTSFFALAVLFFLLGAPVVAVFEVIIYAGAIMVLFLFVIMMLDLGHPEKAKRPGIGDWWPALVLGGVTVAAAATLVVKSQPVAAGGGGIGVTEFAVALFRKYGLAVEVISMQLLFALVGALYLGKRREK